MGLLRRFRVKVTLPIVAALAIAFTVMGAAPPAYALNGDYNGWIAIQGNNNQDLWAYSPEAGQIVNTEHEIRAGSSPALMCNGIPCIDAAWFPNPQGLLCYDILSFQGNPGGVYGCTDLGMDADTSAAVDRNGAGFEVAFNASSSSSTHYLWLYNSVTGKGTNTGLGIAAGTNPSIISYYSSSYGPDGFQVAFQDTQGYLCVYLSAGNSHRCTGLGMAPGTSPSLTDAYNFGEVFFNAQNTDNLYEYNYGPNTSRDLGSYVYPGTSPAAMGAQSDNVWVAFEGGDTDLTVYASAYSPYPPADEGFPMACCTSPSITYDSSTPAGDADPPEIAFESDTGLLSMFDWWDLAVDYTGYGLEGGSSPSFDGATGATGDLELNWSDPG
jgi:hypothetical protein